MAVSPRNSGSADDLDAAPVSDINVTPLVDVMLVLLIVFMVAAPLMTTGVPLNLPKSQAQALEEKKPPLVVSLDDKGGVFIDKAAVAKEALPDQLRHDAGPDGIDRRIHIRADKTLPYGQVMEIMGTINHAGFRKVALVSEAAPSGGKP